MWSDGALRDLPSFPTRRSSDLALAEGRPRDEVRVLKLAAADERAFDAGEIGRHTSELQSHSDLVCRLLLEKKKASNHIIGKCPTRYRPTAEPPADWRRSQPSPD